MVSTGAGVAERSSGRSRGPPGFFGALRFKPRVGAVQLSPTASGLGVSGLARPDLSEGEARRRLRNLPELCGPRLLLLLFLLFPQQLKTKPQTPLELLWPEPLVGSKHLFLISAY